MTEIKPLAIAMFLIFLCAFRAYSCTCLGPDEFKTKEDLEPYHFIALVAIDSIALSETSKTLADDIFYWADLTILELFKGDSINALRVRGGNASLGGIVTSCDIGIDPKEKWVVFANKDQDDQLSINYCSFSIMYADAYDVRDWKHEHGIQELNLLRELYNADIPAEHISNGIHKTYYKSGAIEIIEFIENGLLNGSKTIYYPNGELMIKEQYEQGKRTGESLWYDRKGRLERDFQFSNGHPIDTCFYYWASNGQVKYEEIYTASGDWMQETSFQIDGVLKSVAKMNTLTNEYIKTDYYESGAVEYVTIHNSESFQAIRTTAFYESGAKEKVWEYYPNDSTKFYTYWEWNRDGELSRNFLLMTDWTKTELLENAENKR